MWKDIYQTNSKWTINYINDLEDMLGQVKEKLQKIRISWKKILKKPVIIKKNVTEDRMIL